MKKYNNVCIYTGNILNVNDIKRKAWMSPSEELLESLKSTIKESNTSEDTNGDTLSIFGSSEIQMRHEEEPAGLVTSVKVFLSSPSGLDLNEAVNKLLAYLDIECIDSLVLSYEGNFEETKQIWEKLEEIVKLGKISRIGISDLTPALFMDLHSIAEVKPSIVQINLASCCVVPPVLRDYTKQHDIQLLTHNDPKDILTQEDLKGVLENCESVTFSWAVRFQVHVKCRGVLANKGYIVSLSTK